MMWAKVQWRFEGTHYFPNMPAELEHVKFLEFKHRHEFHCTVWAEVKHDNREIEYLDLKKALKEAFSDGNWNGKSCEMIARNIADFVWERHGDRMLKVQVLEDGENGALFEPENPSNKAAEKIQPTQTTLSHFDGMAEVDF